MRQRHRPTFPDVCCRRMTNCSYPFKTRTRMISLYRLQSTCEQHCPFRGHSLRNFMLLVITFSVCVALCASVSLRLSAVWAVFSHSLFSTICCTISAYNYNFTTTPSFNFLPPSDALFLQFCKLVCVWVEKWTESGSEQPPSARSSSINRWDELPEVSFFHCRLFSAFFYSHPKCSQLHFSVLSIMSLIVLAGRNNDGANWHSCKQQTWWSYWLAFFAVLENLHI